MSNRPLATLGASALLTGWIAAGPATAAETAVGLSTRSDLAVTVYGNGLGLIADRRRVVLSKGNNALGVEGLSPALIADSLLATFDKSARVTTITQNRQRARQRDIMRENISKAAHLVRVHPQTGADVLIPATPSLTLGASADEDGPRALDLRYLSDGLKWHPAYTAEWSDADGQLSIKAWAVIDNSTGSDFNGAWLKLVAGQVNRQSAPPPPRPMARAMKAEGAMLAADSGAPAREAFGGYHIYSLPATVDLADGASQQVPLMAEIRIKAERKLISEGYPQAFGSARGSADPTHPLVRLDFTAPSGQTAQPLPAGTVRLYAKDRAGIAQFLGEDRLGDTPRGGKANLDAGRAFDVAVARAQTSFNRESRQVFESGHRLTLHNGGSRPAMVEVVEVIPGDWTILDSDRAHERADGRARWTIEVAAGADAVLNYRVQVRN